MIGVKIISLLTQQIKYTCIRGKGIAICALGYYFITITHYRFIVIGSSSSSSIRIR